MDKKIKSTIKRISNVLILFLIILTVFIGIKAKNEFIKGGIIGEEIKNTISVSGTGKIYAKPDLATISFSVVTEKETVEEALSENSSKMNDVISKMKEEGVKEEKLKTTSFNIRPRYEYRETTQEFYTPAGKRVLVGYEVSQTLETKTKELEKIGDLIDEATKAGANQVNSFNLSIENEGEFKKEAREKAIVAAKEKASNISNQLGVELTKIINFNEQTSFPRYNYAIEQEFAVKDSAKSIAPSIEGGENKIEVSVNITYQIDH